MTLTLTSPAFSDGGRIPDKFARDGENMSPALKWTGTPEGTQSLALIVEDPDAPKGLFRHFIAYNIPPDRTELPQSVDTDASSGLRFGRNDFGGDAYDGPQPPVGDTPHHYFFQLHALNKALDLRDGFSYDDLQRGFGSGG